MVIVRCRSRQLNTGRRKRAALRGRLCQYASTFDFVACVSHERACDNAELHRTI